MAHSPQVQNYILKARIKDGEFEQSVDIFVIPKRYSVLVQTDKPFYKPGDKVNFRVLIINSEMKLHELSHFSIYIEDKFGNIIKAIEDDLHLDTDRFDNGVITDSFQLLEEPVMGKYNIRVMTNDKEEDTNHIVTLHPFEVKQYILPRFKVNIETKTDLSHDEITIDLNVSANYTFGELVVGTAEAFAEIYDSAFPGVVQYVSPKKKVEVKTMQTISFNIKNDLKIVNAIRPYYANFSVHFTETLTGQVATAEVEVRVFRIGAYNVKILRAEKRFKPGFNYNFTTIVRKFDGTFSPTTNSIQVSVVYYYTPHKCTKMKDLAKFGRTFTKSLEEPMVDGRYDFSIHIPSNTSAINITAQYFAAQASINVVRQESKSREYIKAHLLNT